MRNRNILSTILFLGLGVLMLFQNCAPNTGFILDQEEVKFSQSQSVVISQKPIDILWVIDNSGSMGPKQESLKENFRSFIQEFERKGIDYQMAVTNTEAYTQSGDELLFKDGNATESSGVRVMTPQTPNLREVFQTNIKQGARGNQYEKGLKSMKKVLSYGPNLATPFPRREALLVVVLVSDEQDTSPMKGTDFPQQKYFDFLHDLTNSSGNHLNFMVNIIGFTDACSPETPELENPGKVAVHGMAMADRTEGYKGCITDDFTGLLEDLSHAIVEKSAVLKLDREPIIETIVVRLNGVPLEMDSENGWTYSGETREILLHGEALEEEREGVISISFDPAGLK